TAEARYEVAALAATGGQHQPTLWPRHPSDVCFRTEALRFPSCRNPRWSASLALPTARPSPYLSHKKMYRGAESVKVLLRQRVSADSRAPRCRQTVARTYSVLQR